MNSRGHGGFGWKYGLIDLSSNINPLGTPRELVELIREAVEQGHYVHHPTELSDELRTALADYEGVDPSLTYVFNGATEALQLLIMYLRPRRVLIPIPNYGDYIRIARLIRVDPITPEYWGSGDLVDLIRDKQLQDTIVVVSNPNSPMGYLVPRDELLNMAEELGRRGGLLIVDESFMDFVKDRQSLIRDVVSHGNVVVVKSYTKFLAIPGLRVGTIYTSMGIEELVPTWPVNSIAEYAVSRYMRYAREFREETVAFIENERVRVMNALDSLGIQYYRSTTHYIVIRHEPWLGDELKKRGFLIRDLSNTPPLTKGYFRFSLRGLDVDDKFLNVLREIIQIKQEWARVSNECGFKKQPP